ncbi:phosphate ABC transporter substrate-binding protein [Paraburkholderia phosphatilytica]|uniref:phosphate ABC transporter substrate-binding protein n=1 Tax=Paraburkholderia phosphatilytica TaxID=2282883 RepID=UPI000E46CA80|nr:phosphate ABC transporter substrate-binding protein [Paraburkholderia phosphatilytica]
MNHTKRILQTGLVGVALWLCASVCDAQLVVIVSAKNPVSTLSENQVADIYLGRTSQLPGGGDVVPVDLADDSANRTEFYKDVAGKSPAQLRAYWSKLIFTGRGQPPREVADATAVKKLVANGANTIGYIEKSELDPSVKAVLTLH